MKYLRIFLLSIQSEMQYRANLFAWLLVNIIPTITFIWVWLAILGNRTDISGYTKGDFIFYYLFMTLMWYVVGGNFNRAVGDAIKNGDINKGLLKPYNVIVEKFLSEQGWKAISLLFALPPFILVMYYFRDSIHIQLSATEWLLFFLSLLLGALIFALIDAIVGLTSFWLVDIWSMATLAEICTEIFGGRMAPLTLIPAGLQTVAAFLPFKYMFFIPTTIITSKSANPLFDVLCQLWFVILMLLIYRFIWHLGIKKYESIGG